MKIYLDQKDYISIVSGIEGNQKYRDDLIAYTKLIDLVDDNKIKIFYSWCHLHEAFKYSKSDEHQLKIYSEIVDKLTRGNCIKHPFLLLKIETELILSDKFGFNSEYGTEYYPYGIGSDSIGEKFEFPDNSLQQFIEGIERNILRSNLSQKQKKYLAKRLKNPKLRNKMIEEAIRHMNIEQINSAFPFTTALDKKDLLDFYLGNTSDKLKAKEKFERNAFNFRVLTRFKDKFSKILQGIKDDAETMINLILESQRFTEITKMEILEDSFLDNELQKASRRVLGNIVKEVSVKYGFSYEEGMEILQDSDLKRLKSYRIYFKLLIEYAKRHRGSLKSKRTPEINDLMDINHARNIPYIDIYVAERFFSDIAKSVSKEYSVKIFRNLNELTTYIEQILI